MSTEEPSSYASKFPVSYEIPTSLNNPQYMPTLYANVAAVQPIKPRLTTRPQTIQPDAYPCSSRCLANALIFTTTEEEYTSQIETTLRSKGLDDFTKAQRTLDHSEHQAFPCSNSAKKRDFSQPLPHDPSLKPKIPQSSNHTPFVRRKSRSTLQASPFLPPRSSELLSYEPPPVFLSSGFDPDPPRHLQRLQYGLSYQTASKPPDQQFLSSFMAALDLPANTAHSPPSHYPAGSVISSETTEIS